MSYTDARTAGQEWTVMKMPDLCTDNRFELIDKYRQRLVQATNIAMNLDEMKVLDSILFRFWQMGWLDRLEEEKRGRWEEDWLASTSGGGYRVWRCNLCGGTSTWKTNYCPDCGARMDGGIEDETD